MEQAQDHFEGWNQTKQKPKWFYKYEEEFCYKNWCQNAQHNDTQNNGTEHCDALHKRLEAVFLVVCDPSMNEL